LVERFAHKEFYGFRTKRRGEWFSADVREIESFVSSLVRIHCGYEPDLGREASSGDNLHDEEEDDEYTRRWKAELDLNLSKRVALAEDLAASSADVPFSEWYEQNWTVEGGWERPVLDAMSDKTRGRLVNFRALVDALQNGFDEAADDCPHYAEILDRALSLWLNYRTERPLNVRETSLLFAHLQDFAKRWDEMESNRSLPLPHLTIAGRSMSLDLYDYDFMRARIDLGFGVSLIVHFTSEAPNLLDLRLRKAKLGEMADQTLKPRHIKSAWIDTWHGTSLTGHGRSIRARELMLSAFLETECISCFKPAIGFPEFTGDETIIDHLENQCRKELFYLSQHHEGLAASFRHQARNLVHDVQHIIDGIVEIADSLPSDRRREFSRWLRNTQSFSSISMGNFLNGLFLGEGSLPLPLNTPGLD